MNAILYQEVILFIKLFIVFKKVVQIIFHYHNDVFKKKMGQVIIFIKDLIFFQAQ